MRMNLFHEVICHLFPQRPALAREGCDRYHAKLNGGPHRFPRDDKLQTPPGPEGSNGSSGLGRRGAAGAGCLQTLMTGGRQAVCIRPAR